MGCDGTGVTAAPTRPRGPVVKSCSVPEGCDLQQVFLLCGWHSTTVEIDTAGTLQEAAGELGRS